MGLLTYCNCNYIYKIIILPGWMENRENSNNLHLNICTYESTIKPTCIAYDENDVDVLNLVYIFIYSPSVKVFKYKIKLSDPNLKISFLIPPVQVLVSCLYSILTSTLLKHKILILIYCLIQFRTFILSHLNRL